MNFLSTSEPASDRRFDLLLTVAILTALVVIIFAAVAGPKILSSASTTAAIKRGDELAACRAGYRTEVDDAAARLQTSRAWLDTLTNAGLEAVVVGDDQALAVIAGDLPAARAEVEQKAAGLEQETAHYRELIELSRTAPSRFLDSCRKDQG